MQLSSFTPNGSQEFRKVLVQLDFSMSPSARQEFSTAENTHDLVYEVLNPIIQTLVPRIFKKRFDRQTIIGGLIIDDAVCSGMGFTYQFSIVMRLSEQKVATANYQIEAEDLFCLAAEIACPLFVWYNNEPIDVVCSAITYGGARATPRLNENKA